FQPPARHLPNHTYKLCRHSNCKISKFLFFMASSFKPCIWRLLTIVPPPSSNHRSLLSDLMSMKLLTRSSSSMPSFETLTASIGRSNNHKLNSGQDRHAYKSFWAAKLHNNESLEQSDTPPNFEAIEEVSENDVEYAKTVYEVQMLNWVPFKEMMSNSFEGGEDKGTLTSSPTP
ncbi:hypothetical protein GOP47_0006847, partial [Adiantum capillus-veneris]